MQLLNSLPLIGIILGLFTLMFIIPDRKNFVKNRLAKIILVGIVLLNIVSQLDRYLYFNDVLSDIAGITYLFSHLYGFLFFLYICALQNVKIKRWAMVAFLYTILRIILVLIVDENIDYSKETISSSYSLLVIWADYYISVLLNIGFLVAAYHGLKRINFMVKLNDNNKTSILWFKRFLLISVLTYMAIGLLSIIADFEEIPLVKQDRIESLILNILFFITAFFAIKFPLFYVDGDFSKTNSTEIYKYSKSSLSVNDSKQIWEHINEIMQIEKAYKNPEYRLTNLAETCGKSVHHISQVINKESESSFSEFINKHRIEEAKILLLSEKAKELTILALAYEVGFNSKTTFYSAFKKECKMTPSEYMKSQ